MVTRTSVRAGVCLMVLIGAWTLAGGILASQAAQVRRQPVHRLLPGYAATSRRAHHSSRAVDDDGLTHFPAQLQALEVLPSSAFLLSFTLFAIPGPERDLLTLTQRRRE